MSSSLRILAVIAAPVMDLHSGQPTVQLNPRQEWRNIVTGCEGRSTAVRVERLPMATEKHLNDALAQAALEAPYAVVHITGHGHKGLLALDDGYGCVHRVDARTLGETFQQRGVQLVVLNACHSAEAAGDLSVADALVAAGVPAVIGMTKVIRNGPATLLADVLYQRLASGYSVSAALEEARLAIRHDPDLRRLGLTDDAEVPVVLGHSDLKLQPGPVEPGVFPNNPPNELPHNPYFFGRQEELVRIARALADTTSSAVALSGPGGIGKSALAVEAAWRNAWRFRAVIWVTLREGESRLLETAQDAARRLLGLQPSDDLLAALHAIPCFLVLDNLHWLPKAEWPDLCNFLRRLDPSLNKVLLTYRTPWRGLQDLAGVYECRLPDLDPASAVALLQTEGWKKGASWLLTVTAEDLLELARLCRHHPYFLRQGAARAARQPLAQLRDDLAGLRGKFQKWAGDFLDGQVAILGEDGKALLPRLSVFAGSADREAVTAVCGEGLKVDTALLEVTAAALVDYLPEEARYRLHDLTQAYAQAMLSQEEALTLGRRHAEHYLQVARLANSLMGTDQARSALAMVEAERANLLWGQQWHAEQEEWERVIAYGYALEPVFDVGGFWADRVYVLQRSLEASERKGDQAEQEKFLHHLGMLAQDQGDYAAARRYYQQSLEIAQALGGKSGQQKTLHQLGMLARLIGDIAKARRLNEKSYQMAVDLGDRQEEAILLHELGMLAQAQGDYAAARRFYQQAGEAFEALGARKEQSAVLHQLGILAKAQGDYAAAGRFYQQSLEIAQALGDRAGVSKTLHQLGVLAQAQGDYPAAWRFYQQSLEIAQALGDRAGAAISMAQMALLEEAEGNVVRALELIRQAEATFRQLGSPMAEQARRHRERLEQRMSEKH
jgi:tetratricopeptide (TPR) repeat protein